MKGVDVLKNISIIMTSLLVRYHGNGNWKNYLRNFFSFHDLVKYFIGFNKNFSL